MALDLCKMISCADTLQVISLSDIFISPLEDMYVRGFPHFLVVY